MWFVLGGKGDTVRVDFDSTPPRPWVPRDLLDYPFPVDIVAGRSVLLSGRAPMWMYAHLAALAVRGGVRDLAVEQPQVDDPVRVFPTTEQVGPQTGWLRHERSESGGSIVRFVSPDPGQVWAPEVLGSLSRISGDWSQDLLTLTGVGANWMYGAVAAAAATRPGRMLAYFSPLSTESIVLTPAPNGAVTVAPDPLLRPKGQQGLVIGIVGDPNSGKSVLAALLEFGLRHAGLTPAWRLDCDYQAPTPHWYLQMLHDGRAVDAVQLRESQKRQWTAEAEQMIAARLRDCSRSLAWTVADLPGGIHVPGNVQRVPPGREILLAAVDAFLVVARVDCPEAEAAWLRELQRLKLSDRVVGVVRSQFPDAHLAVKVHDESPLRIDVCGLDRRHLASDQVRRTLNVWGRVADSIARTAHLKL